MRWRRKTQDIKLDVLAPEQKDASVRLVEMAEELQKAAAEVHRAAEILRAGVRHE